MNRYHHKSGATYCYRDKKALITDLCEEMQRVRKEYLEHKKERGTWNTYWLHKKFELLVGKHLEWWDFQIDINDVFTVRECVADIGTPNGVIHGIKYCCNPNSHGELDNVFRNITEFRAFITREINKEEATE